MSEQVLSLEELTVVSNILSKKQKALLADFDEIKEIQKRQEKAIDKQNILLEELQSNFSGNSENGGNAASSIATVSALKNEDLQLKLKELLLEDEELLEIFSKVIENVATYNHNKDKVDKYVEEQAKKKKRKKYVFISIICIITLALSIYYYIFELNKTITIPGKSIFYELNKKDGYTMPESIIVNVVDEDENRYFFELKNKKYYISKDALK